MSKHTNLAGMLAAALTLGTTVMAETNLDIQFAGTLEFAENGTLFVGDNYNGNL